MWTLIYSGHKAAVVQGNRYIYEFDSLDSAKAAVKEATQIYVVYEHGRGQLTELSPVVKQQMKVIPPQSYPVE